MVTEIPRKGEFRSQDEKMLHQHHGSITELSRKMVWLILYRQGIGKVKIWWKGRISRKV